MKMMYRMRRPDGRVTEKLKFITGAVVGAAFALLTSTASASIELVHSGATDPVTEGFGVWPYTYGSAMAGPINVDADNDRDAWSVSGLSAHQLAYYSTALTATERADVSRQGFVLSVVARVRRGDAPAYTAASPIIVAAVAVSNGSERFDIDLGVNAAGDTVVMLPDYIEYIGGLAVTPGASYTLTNAGTGYHSYELSYNPSTRFSNLTVDGVVRIDDYAGFSNYSPAEGNSRGLYGLLWGGMNVGQADFADLRLASPVPEPSSWHFMCSGLIGIAAIGRKLRPTGIPA